MMADELIETEVAKKRAEREKAEAEAAVARAQRAKVESGDSGTSGGIKITGNFDIFQLLAAQQSDLKQLKDEAEESASRQAGISDDLRERLHAKELDVMKTSFEAQMQTLTNLIASNASKGNFFEQYNQAKELATQLGYVAPGAATSDLQTTLALKKLEYEHGAEERRNRREERAEQRKWDLELRRLDDEREARRKKEDREAKRDEMFANAPAMVGGAIAKGLIDHQGTGGVANSTAPGSTKKARHSIQAGEGESGEAECAECSAPVAVGPTARSAVCANCGTKFSIKRVQGAAEEEE